MVIGKDDLGKDLYNGDIVSGILYGRHGVIHFENTPIVYQGFSYGIIEDDNYYPLYDTERLIKSPKYD